MIVPFKTSLRMLSDTTGQTLQSIAQGGTVVGSASTSNFVASELSDGVVRGARPASGDPTRGTPAFRPHSLRRRR